MADAAEVVALFGPTAVGKTSVALALADELRARGRDPVAISADALAVYDALPIVTAQPTAEERARLEHRLVGFVPVTERFSVGDYMPLAHAEIDAALEAGRTPIVVGGTGLYLRAALCDLELRPKPPPEVRERWARAVEERGPEALHAELAAVAPWAAERIPPTDRTRVARALELHEIGALEPEPAESQLWTSEMRRPTALCGLVMKREDLYRRIDERAGAMVAAGAEEEVRRADAAGASATARKALGFEELLRGDVEGMRLRSRRYAKRQLTWMRKLPGVRVTDVTGRPPEDVARELAEAILI